MLTVGKLKKALKGLPDNTPVYTQDHDHAEYETNGLARYATLMNQKDATDYQRKQQDLDGDFKIEGPYLVIRV